MHRFFIPPAQIRGERVFIEGKQAHQMTKVLRLGTGDQVIVLDDRGWMYQVELISAKSSNVEGIVRQKSPALGEPSIRLTVCQSLLKYSNFEWVLQKGTELGVAQFLPVITKRSIVRAKEVKENKWRRWQTIVQEAAEQCGRGRLPTLAGALTMEEALRRAQQADLIVMPKVDRTGVNPSLHACLANHRGSHGLNIFLFTGPEGGFTEDEAKSARAAGACLVTLGPRILRAETATIVAVTLIMQDMGQLQ